MKYVKKPIPVEAIKIPDLTEKHTMSEWDKIMPEWFDEACRDHTLEVFYNEETKAAIGFMVSTLEGDMLCAPGNYLIRGVKGELYPCRADIFEETYEEWREE